MPAASLGEVVHARVILRQAVIAAALLVIVASVGLLGFLVLFERQAEGPTSGGLLDESTMQWLEQERLLVLAWTVNELGRVNELVKLGVDAITADNLVALALLGGQERDEASLLGRAR